MRRLAIILFALSGCAFAQYTPPSGSGGPCVLSGSQTSGYVLTATDNGTGCNWQSVGGASVDASTIKNAEYCPDTSVSANTITCSTTTTFPTLAAGQVIRVKVANTNTGATTIAVSGGASKNVTKFGTTALASGNLVAASVYLFAYDGTEWQVLQPKLLAADIPTLNQNTSGTAANLSGTPALPNGTTATTQSQADNSTKLATTAYADTLGATKAASNATTTVAGASCSLGGSCSPASTGLSDGSTIMKTIAPPLEVSASVTLYMCPGTATNCAYNGDGGQSATPSNTCSFTSAQSKATPCSPTGMAALLANLRTSGATVLTVQLADAYASTTPTCYQLSAFAINGGALQGGTPTDIYQTVTNGANVITPVFPPSYVYFHGNTSAPSQVIITGSSTCSGTTVDTARGFLVDNAVARFSGMKLQYYGVGAPAPRSTGAIDAHHSLVFVDNLVGQGAGSTNAGCMVSAIQRSYLQFGGTNSVTDWCAFVLTGADGQFSSPAGSTDFTYASNSWANQVIHVQEGSHLRFDIGTYRFTGTGAYTIWSTQQRGGIFWGDVNTGSKVIKFTLNASNATWDSASYGGVMNVPCDNNATQIQCTSDGNAFSIGVNNPVYKIRASASYQSIIAVGQMSAGTTADSNKDAVICSGAFPFTCNSGIDSINGTVVSGITGTTNLVFSNSPTLVTPTIGAATATSVNGLTITTSTGTLTIPNSVVLTGPAASGTAATLGNNETFAGDKTFTGAVDMSGSASALKVPVIAGCSPGTSSTGICFDSTQHAYSTGNTISGTGTTERTLSVQTPAADTVTCNGTNVLTFATGYTIPANFFIAGKVLRLYMVFQVVSGSSTVPTHAITVKLGSSAIFTNVASAQGASITRSGAVVFEIVGTAAPGAAANVVTGETAIAVPFNTGNTTSQPVALATNGSLALSLTDQCSATGTGTNSMQILSMRVAEAN